MKNPAGKLISAIILGTVFFNAGFSFAQNKEIISTDETKIYFSEDENSAERKREFWEKFRESVKPREEKPHEEERPREVHPHEVKPHEVD